MTVEFLLTAFAIPSLEHRVWITGAGGLIGSALLESAPAAVPAWKISGTTRRQVDLTDGAYTTYARLTVGSRPPAAPLDQSNMNDPVGWCVSLTDPKGAQKTFKYSAMNGLQSGGCP